MPFTPSHAIVALPFARTPLVPAAVAVGAMAPDLPLFVRGTPLDYGWTHDPMWLPATMGLAFALLLLWRCVLRPAARELVPAAIADRLPLEWNAGARAAARETVSQRGSDRASLRGVLLLAVALAIGVASHLVWDAFSHAAHLAYRVLPPACALWGLLTITVCVAVQWARGGRRLAG